MAYYKDLAPGTVHQARNWAEARVTELGDELGRAKREIDDLRAAVLDLKRQNRRLKADIFENELRQQLAKARL